MPPAPREASKVSVYSPTSAPPWAESRSCIVHWLEEPVVGTTGRKVTSSASDVPRLPKYSTDRGGGRAVDPASV